MKSPLACLLLLLFSPCTLVQANPPAVHCGARPVVIQNNCAWNGWNRWGGWGWNAGWWGPSYISITYGNPTPTVSSGFGTISVPETKIHKVPAPINLTKPLIIQEGTSFQWKK